VTIAVAVAALFAACPASAGADTWKQVTASGGTNIDEVSHVRTPDGVLHVAWHKGGDLNHTVILANGKLGATAPIQTGWAGDEDPAIVAVPGGLRVFWGGIRSTEPTETNQDMNTAFSPDGGTTWQLTTGSIIPLGAQSYGSDASATTLPNGTTLQAWAGTLGTWVHAGLDPATPNTDYQAALAGCCGYNPGLATSAAGNTMMAWFSNATDHTGVFAQAVNASGGPAGAAMTMPGTQNMSGSEQLSRTPIVARAKNGGFYVAYAVGYPTADKVRLWKVGSASTTLVASVGNGSMATLAADPKGRLWAVWREGQFGSVHVMAARSDKDVGTFGAPVDAGAVKNASTAYSLDASATATSLDVLALFGVGTEPGGATYTTRVLPGLTLRAKRSKDRVTFSVTDAGDPVKGAKVKAGGKSDTTDSNGRTTLTLKSKATAVATAAGYTAATLKVKAPAR
jgi:hypothetical protein